MATKIITIATTPPTESSGADYNKGNPLNPVEFDQNLINLRAAIDRRATKSATVLDDTLTVNTDALKVLSNKNVGFGIAAPNEKIAVNVTNDYTGQEVALMSGQSGAVTVSGIYNYVADSPNGDCGILFKTHRYGVYSEKVRITDAGYVGIGKIPTSALDVLGLIKSSAGFSATAGGQTLTIDNITNYGASLVLNAGGSLPIIFKTDSIARMAIESSGVVSVCNNGGSLLVGTTLANGAKIVVEGAVYVNGSIYLANGNALNTWGVQPLPFAINGSEAARFTADKKFLIGATVSVSADKLQVNGGIAFVNTVTNPGAFSPTHKVPVTVNGTTYYMALTAA